MASHRQPRKWRSGYFGKLKLDIRSQLAIVFVSIILLVDGGCADPSAKFIPSPKRAEDALSQAMEAWKAGKPAGEIVGTKPEIYVTDNHRHRKRELGSFKILGETPGRSGRTYAVELVLKQPDEKVKTEEKTRQGCKKIARPPCSDASGGTRNQCNGPILGMGT